MLKKSLAIFALAAVSFFAFTAPANAVDPYPPAGPCATVSGTPAPGATVTISFTDGCFAPSEQYDVTVTGVGTITLDGVVAASVRKIATPTGAGSIQVTLPQDATGAYVVTGFGVASQRSCSVTLDVASSSPAVVIPTVATTSTTPTASLASTGYETPTLALLGAGGLVLIGAGIVISLARRRRAGVKRSL